jgi:hypothetical protein
VVEKGSASAINAYGDGNASQQIVDIMKKLLSAGNGLKLPESLPVAGGIV